MTIFELMSPLYDAEKHETRGKLFTVTRDADGSGAIDTDDIEFSGYLEGDGDFRSEEVCQLRDEADIIITNPPFSMFSEFLLWIVEAGKQFVIIGNQNAISYRDVFPLIKDNKIWLGQGFKSNVGYFYAPLYEDYASAGQHKEGLIRVSGVMWFTNIDHGIRHETLLLDTMAHNLKFNKKLRKKLEEEYGMTTYPRYECIPSDYDGVMGVPRTFLCRYNPEQFEIVGRDGDIDWAENSGDFFTPPAEDIRQKYKKMNKTWRVQNSYVVKDGEPKTIYARIFIRHKKGGNA